MKLLRCENLFLKYDNHQAVSDVRFDIDSGDYMCIVGENGSGKTTLIKCMLGIMKQESGTIHYSINRSEIGYLPQHVSVANDFPASVYEVVLSGRLNKGGKGFYTADDKKSAERNIAEMDIGNIRNKSYRELSGGQRQRVLLARALCASDKLLVLDEPSAGLDPVVMADFLDIIRSLNRDRELAVIMISHDIPVALRESNKILHLNTSMLYFGSTADYKKTDICKRILGGGHYA